ncbi:uncharacterized protein LOC108629195 [Ceratina calcarata]|uniref:Uncharacterized protein LOC108629195 n=1 Tax=Ceratina calcarata TaxID=156304 RepID=A0AAJ7WE28_9HYME|nr:uncharacterized protein LOC108629195 [Ceratina calcarata]
MECDIRSQDRNASSDSDVYNVSSHEDILEGEIVSSCSTEVHTLNAEYAECINSLMTRNVEERNDNSALKVQSLTSNDIFKKSLANIDLDLIPFVPENLVMIKTLLFNSKTEIISLRRKINTEKMKMYRFKKRVKSLTSLMKHNKDISENISNLLQVSA